MPSEFEPGRLLGTLDATFPWGLLVVSDEGASDEIPPWQTDTEQVTSTPTTIVVRVEHAQEGPAVIHVYRGAGDLPGMPAFRGAITTREGVLIVGDAVGDQRIRVAGLARSLTLEVLLDPPVDANHVDVVIRDEPAELR